MDRIPILKIGEILIATIQTALDDGSVKQFQSDILTRVSRTEAHGVVIDITAIEIVDSFLARALNEVAVATKIIGARTVLVGIQPSVAITLVQMGLRIPDAESALNLERGMRLARRSLDSGDVHGN